MELWGAISPAVQCTSQFAAGGRLGSRLLVKLLAVVFPLLLLRPFLLHSKQCSASNASWSRSCRCWAFGYWCAWNGCIAPVDALGFEDIRRPFSWRFALARRLDAPSAESKRCVNIKTLFAATFGEEATRPVHCARIWLATCLVSYRG